MGSFLSSFIFLSYHPWIIPALTASFNTSQGGETCDATIPYISALLLPADAAISCPSMWDVLKSTVTNILRRLYWFSCSKCLCNGICLGFFCIQSGCAVCHCGSARTGPCSVGGCPRVCGSLLIENKRASGLNLEETIGGKTRVKWSFAKYLFAVLSIQ